MATIKKCDHCGAIIKSGQVVSVSIIDSAKFFEREQGSLVHCVECCAMCIDKYAKVLCKIFPGLKVAKNTEDKFYEDIFADKKIVATANQLGRTLEKISSKKTTKKQIKK